MREQCLTHLNCGTLDQVWGKFEFARSEHHYRRTTLEITQFLALEESCVAGYIGGAVVFEIERSVDEVQPDTRNQYRGNGNKRHICPGNRQLKRQNCPFIPAEEPLEPPERDRIDVPCISRDVA